MRSYQSGHRAKLIAHPCASKFRNLPLQAKAQDMSELCTCAKRFRGPRGHDFALMGLAFIYPVLSTCLVVYVQKSDFHLISTFYVVIVVKKCTMSGPGSLLLYCTA